MLVRDLLRKATRDQYRVIEDAQFWTPTFSLAFFDWCDNKAYEEPEGVLIRGDLALALAKKTDDRHVIAKAHGVMASAYRMRTLYDYSEAELQKAAACASACPCCMKELHRRHGVLRIHQRQFTESITSFDASIAACRTVSDRDGIGRTLVSRGVSFWKLEQIEEALLQQQEALSYLSPLSPKIYHLGILTNIAQFLASADDALFARAEGYCNEFRKYLAGLDGFTSVRVRLSWAHGLILVRLGERKRGIQMLRSARQALIHARHDSEVIAITADLASIYCDTYKYRFIIELFREALLKLGDIADTRPLLKKVLRLAEREHHDTRTYVLALRAAVSAAIPNPLSAPVDVFSTP